MHQMKQEAGRGPSKAGSTPQQILYLLVSIFEQQNARLLLMLRNGMFLVN